jgi:hypothetical protein
VYYFFDNFSSVVFNRLVFNNRLRYFLLYFVLFDN